MLRTPRGRNRLGVQVLRNHRSGVVGLEGEVMGPGLKYIGYVPDLTGTIRPMEIKQRAEAAITNAEQENE